MARRRIRLGTPAAALQSGFDDVRRELEVPTAFAPEVLAEVEQTARQPLDMGERVDATDLDFLTIDPPGSMDLDQAMHLSTSANGFRVRYAIADVAAFVPPGGVLDAETHRRGETLYLPDARTPLHPPVMSEGAASLLPDVVRPAMLWTIDLDEKGERVATDVRRAVVRSRRRLDYAGVQRQLDDGDADEQLQLLRRIGQLREARERDRGGISLPVPEQEVVERGTDYVLAFRAPLPVDGWNAQISLLTGMAAADLMLRGGVGILRTVPPATSGALNRLRRIAGALDIRWDPHTPYPDFIRSLDPAQPADAALLQAATSVLRGAAYVAFEGGLPPDQPAHAAIAAPYSHVTAPLRRLVDRYSGEVCLALAAGREVPAWAATALPLLPDEMASADRRAGAADRAAVDLVEAAVLAPHVGTTYDAMVIDAEEDKDSGVVQVQQPAVRARCDGGPLPLGERIRVRLTTADTATRTVRFARA